MISDEAVEAAVEAFNEQTGNLWESNYVRPWIQSVLEAAAPYLLADAWDDGMMYGSRGQFRDQEDFKANPHRSQD